MTIYYHVYKGSTRYCVHYDRQTALNIAASIGGYIIKKPHYTPLERVLHDIENAKKSRSAAL